MLGCSGRSAGTTRWDAAFEPHRADGLVPGTSCGPAPDRLRRPDRGRRGARAAPRTRAPRDLGEPSSRSSATGSASIAGRRPEILAVLPRRTKFSRRAAHDPGGSSAREQVVAANVDVVFVTWSLADEPEPRVLERYLTLAWESGARPVIFLTKADLERRSRARSPREVEEIGGDVAVHAVSTRTGLGLDAVRSELGPRRHRSAARPVGRRQVHAREHARRRGAPRDAEPSATTAPGGTRRRTGQLVLLPGGGLSSTTRECARCTSGSPTRASRTRSRTSPSWRPSCRFADCRHEQRAGLRGRGGARGRDASTPSGGGATASSSASSQSSRRS